MKIQKGSKGFVSRPLADRFWEKVTVASDDECWNWTGSKDPNGRGSIWNDGRLHKAPRISWELHFGAIPDGKMICHTCDNPSCVNPKHLFVGSMSDNIRDCCNKKRHGSYTKPGAFASGERNGTKTHPLSVLKGEQLPQSKLSEKDVLFILETRGTLKQKDAAKMFNVSTRTICAIRSGERWKHLFYPAGEKHE